PELRHQILAEGGHVRRVDLELGGAGDLSQRREQLDPHQTRIARSRYGRDDRLSGDGMHPSLSARRSSDTLGSTVGRIAFLTDRSPQLALPALQSLGLDVKTEPLTVDSLGHLPEIGPSMVFADAEENPEQAF